VIFKAVTLFLVFIVVMGAVQKWLRGKDRRKK
jgi:hypothetical protein